MVDEDLGEATIVYEDPDEGTVERTVQNEYLAYFQDHWIVRTGEDDEGRDLVRRIPRSRVHYVERTVEEFEEEVSTLKNRVQSAADDLRSRLLGDDESSERESITVSVADDDDETETAGDRDEGFGSGDEGGAADETGSTAEDDEE